MKFSERTDYIYDPKIFSADDTQTALKIHHEYIVRNTGRPLPVFFEMSREAADFDPVWGQPTRKAASISRRIELPCLIIQNSRRWNPTAIGQINSQALRFWTSNQALREADYFPLPGDGILWGGYRYEIVSPEFEPTCFWQQTNVWLGIVYNAVLAVNPDTRPQATLSVVPSELRPSSQNVQVSRSSGDSQWP